MDETLFNAEVTIRFVRYANESTGWAVLDAAAQDGSPMTLVGPLVHLERGERARIIGSWVIDSRYGSQVKVTQADPLAPQDPDALIGYLKRVKHVGASRAARLVAAHGPERVFDVIDADPAAALGGVGIAGRRAEEAAESWQTLRVTRRLHLLLAPHGLAYLAGRIHDRYGDRAHEIVSANPYELTSVFGVGFMIADRIALSSGTDGAAAPAEGRERAAILHVLAQAERSGNTCLPSGELFTATAELLGQAPDKLALDQLAERGDVALEGDWIYRAATAELEAELAQRVAQLIDGSPSERLRAQPSQAAPVSPTALTDEQQSALDAALRRRISVVTGGPGTGKTASIRSIAGAATARGARVMLVAPTGRAAYG